LITINVAGDALIEPDENFKVVLSDPVNGIITDKDANGIIRNDDTTPAQLAITPEALSQNEGDSGTTAYSFTVTRSGNTDGEITVDFTVTPIGADADDFVGGLPAGGTLTFADGVTEQTVTVNVAGDTDLEPNEGFEVVLANPSANTDIVQALARGRIVNDNDSSDNDDDVLTGTSGDDVLNGGSGDDTLTGAGGDDALTGGSGDDLLSGGSGNDLLTGRTGDDNLSGGSGDDQLRGGRDNDSLSGGSGNDVLAGGAGDDNLSGGSGDDQLSGGRGNDSLNGGSGNDTFVFTGADGNSGHNTIRLFNADEDTLRFEDYGESLNTFSDLDTNANSVLEEGDAHVSIQAGNTVIDLGGQTDGESEGTLTLVGVTGLEADDMSFS
jgi:Ca2+-binding RTX toxin-like protein